MLSYGQLVFLAAVLVGALISVCLADLDDYYDIPTAVPRRSKPLST